MKVLHINNVAGVASNLVKGLRNKGIKSDLLVLKSHRNQYLYEEVLEQKDPYKILVELFYRSISYDIIHIHDLNYLEQHNIDLYSLRMLNRAINRHNHVVIHFHGSVLRENVSNYSVRILPIFFKVLVSTQDLLPLIKSKWLPNPVDRMVFYDNGSDREGVLYCMKRYEGVDKCERAKTIARNLGQKLSTHLIYLPHSEMPKLLNRYNYFIDQSTYPALSLMGIEALSCGLTVIRWDGKIQDPKILKTHDLYNVTDKLIGYYKKWV